MLLLFIVFFLCALFGFKLFFTASIFVIFALIASIFVIFYIYCVIDNK